MLDHLKRIFKPMKVDWCHSATVAEPQVVATRTPILLAFSLRHRTADLTGEYPPEPKTSAEASRIFWIPCWSSW